MDIKKYLEKINIEKITRSFKNFDFKKLDLKNFDFKKLNPKELDYKKIFNRPKKVDQIVIVDISSKLTLLNVELKPEIKVLALESYDLPEKAWEETVAASITSFIQEKQINHTNAILKPHLESVLIKRIQLPAVPEAELPDSIKWQIKGDLPFDPSEAVSDFIIINRSTKDDGSRILDIVSAAAREAEIRSQVLLLKQAGLNCLAVGLLPFSYASVVNYLYQKSEESVAVWHLDKSLSYIAVCKGGLLQFYRELPISVDKLKESLRRALTSDKGRVELTEAEAQEALFKIGVPKNDVALKEKLTSSQILSMIRPSLERLSVEIKRSLTYFVSEYAGGEIKEILLAGKAVTIPNIDQFLNKETTLVCRKISSHEKSIAVDALDPVTLAESTGDLGMLLNYRQSLNLLPREFRSEKLEKIEKISIRWVAIITFLILFVSYLLARAGMSACQRRLDNARLHLNVLAEIKKTKDNIDEINAFVLGIRNDETAISSILKRLGYIASHRGFFILEFSLDSQSKKGRMSGFVKSTSENPDSILAKFIRQVEETAYFSNVDLSSVSKAKKEGFDITEFDINFDLER